jgi:hypothetical protein
VLANLKVWLIVYVRPSLTSLFFRILFSLFFFFPLEHRIVPCGGVSDTQTKESEKQQQSFDHKKNRFYAIFLDYGST